MLLRVSRGPVVVALLLVFAFASSAAASPERAPAFRDTILSGSAPSTLQSASEWGGPTTATDGEIVNLYFSDAYPVDPDARAAVGRLHDEPHPRARAADGLDPPRAAGRGAAVTAARTRSPATARSQATIYAPARRSRVRHEREGHPRSTSTATTSRRAARIRRSRARTTARSAGPRTRTSARGRGRATSSPAPRTRATTCSTPARRSPRPTGC